jgi:transcriptional regulator with XRE-family HTH domain
LYIEQLEVEMRRPHSYARPTQDAAELFGLQIARARRERRWTATDLAERAGIARGTLHKLESGDPTVGMGIAFEVANLLGIPLFGAERNELPRLVERSRDRLALLPANVRSRVEVDNAF